MKRRKLHGALSAALTAAIVLSGSSMVFADENEESIDLDVTEETEE